MTPCNWLELYLVQLSARRGICFWLPLQSITHSAMRPAGDHSFIVTIADTDGWLFEHVVEAPSALVAERQAREDVRLFDMTFVGVRSAPIVGDASRLDEFARSVRVALDAVTRALETLDRVPIRRSLRPTERAHSR